MAIRKRPTLSVDAQQGDLKKECSAAQKNKSIETPTHIQDEALEFIRSSPEGLDVGLNTSTSERRPMGPATQNALVPFEADKARLLPAEPENIILIHVAAAVSFGVVPVPIFDFVAISGTQLSMIRSLSKHYKQDFDERVGRSLLAALIGGLSPILVGAGMASIFKTVPGVGSVVGGASLASSAGAVTYAVGYVIARHLEEGGSLNSINVETTTNSLRAAYQHGKDIAKEKAKSLSN